MVTFAYSCTSGDGTTLVVIELEDRVGLVHTLDDDADNEDTSVHIATEDAPEVAAAIMQQAGIQPKVFGSYAEQALHYLISHVNERRFRREEREKREEEAQARKLEAAALRLFNAARQESGFEPVESFGSESVLHLYLILANEAEAIFGKGAA